MMIGCSPPRAAKKGADVFLMNFLADEDIDFFDVTDEPTSVTGPDGGTGGGFDFFDFVMAHAWVIFIPFVLFVLIIVVVMLVRHSLRNKRAAQYDLSAQGLAAQLGLDPSTLTVTEAGEGLAMDSSGRRFAVLHLKDETRPPRMLDARQVTGARVDESCVTRVYRDLGSTTTGVDGHMMGSTGGTSSTSWVDRLFLDIYIDDVHDPLISVPFLTRSDSVTQGSRRHLDALEQAKLWQARLESMAQRARGASERR